MTSSFLSCTPISIRLGLFHSLLSFISVSAPLILCAYVLWKYGRKYGVRAYLGVTVGQICFYLFLFYAPYTLTKQWFLFEPLLSLVGCIWTYFFWKNMHENQRFDKLSFSHYAYFSLIMFLNPLRFGTFSNFSPISLMVLNELPNLVYSLFFSIPYFLLNFAFGSLIVYFLNNTIFLIIHEKKITRFFQAVVFTSLLFFSLRLPPRLIIQLPLTNLGLSTKLTQVSGESKSFLRELYNSFFSCFYHTEKNIEMTRKDPNPNIYFQDQSFVQTKIDELEGKEVFDLKFKYKNVYIIRQRMKAIEDFFLIKFWHNCILNFRSPKYLNLNEITNYKSSNISLLSETEEFKGTEREGYLFKNELSQEPILWLRSLSAENRGFSHLKLFFESFFSFEFVDKYLSEKLINDEKIEKNRIFEENLKNLIINFSNSFPQIFENWFLQQKLIIQKEILFENKLELTDLSTEEIEFLNILSEKIFYNFYFHDFSLKMNLKNKLSFNEHLDLVINSQKNISFVPDNFKLNINLKSFKTLNTIPLSPTFINKFKVLSFDSKFLLQNFESNIQNFEKLSFFEVLNKIWSEHYLSLKNLDAENYFLLIMSGLQSYWLDTADNLYLNTPSHSRFYRGESLNQEAGTESFSGRQYGLKLVRPKNQKKVLKGAAVEKQPTAVMPNIEFETLDVPQNFVGFVFHENDEKSKNGIKKSCKKEYTIVKSLNTNL